MHAIAKQHFTSAPESSMSHIVEQFTEHELQLKGKHISFDFPKSTPPLAIAKKQPAIFEDVSSSSTSSSTQDYSDSDLEICPIALSHNADGEKAMPPIESEDVMHERQSDNQKMSEEARLLKEIEIDRVVVHFAVSTDLGQANTATSGSLPPASSGSGRGSSDRPVVDRGRFLFKIKIAEHNLEVYENDKPSSIAYEACQLNKTATSHVRMIFQEQISRKMEAAKEQLAHHSSVDSA